MQSTLEHPLLDGLSKWGGFLENIKIPEPNS